MSIFRLFDSHCHLNDAKFDADREEVIAEMKTQGIGALVVGSDLESSKRAVELAEAHENLWAVVGKHPLDNPMEDFDPNEYRKLLQHPRVVAIGECGFDIWLEMTEYERNERIEDQTRLFLEHLDLALETKKPLVIHCRGEYERLAEHLLPAMKKGVRAHLHFWGAVASVTKVFVDAGCTFSFAGTITYKSKAEERFKMTEQEYAEVIRFLPLDRILAETDAPYAAPVPYRGKRNEPKYVEEVIKKIAEIRGEPFETVRATTVENAKRVFGIM